MAVVDLVDLQFGLWVGKVELLHQRVILVNISGGLHLDIKLVSVIAVGNGIPKMLNIVHPGQQSATEQQAGQLPWLLEEGHELGLALDWV